MGANVSIKSVVHEVVWIGLNITNSVQDRYQSCLLKIIKSFLKYYFSGYLAIYVLRPNGN